MRGGAAARRGDAADQAAIEAGRLPRCELGRHHDARARGGRRGSASEEVAEDPAGDVPHVRGAGAEVLVVGGLERSSGGL